MSSEYFRAFNLAFSFLMLFDKSPVAILLKTKKKQQHQTLKPSVCVCVCVWGGGGGGVGEYSTIFMATSRENIKMTRLLIVHLKMKKWAEYDLSMVVSC